VISISPHSQFAKAAAGFALQTLNRDRRLQKDVQAALDRADAWHKRECLLHADLMMSFVLLMSLKRQSSLRTLLGELISLLRHREPLLPADSITTEALVHARARLGVEPLRALFERRACRIHPEPTFHDLPVWIIDGVDCNLPDTRDNQRAFGRPSGSAFPQLQIVLLMAAESRQVRDFEMGPCNQSERDGCRLLTDSLKSGDLVLGDQGLSGGPQFDQYLDRGIHFLTRTPLHWQPEVIDPLDDGSYLVRVTYKKPLPVEKQKYRKNQSITLTLRMLEYRIGNNERVRLLTDLLDDEQYPASELTDLYHTRWDVETGLDEIKTHLTTVLHGTLHTPFRSKTATGVRQEAYAALIIYNMIRELMLQAGRSHSVPPLELSFVGSLEALRLAIPEFQRAQPEHRLFLLARLLDDIAKTRNPRPRRHRLYPRVVKKKQSSYLTKRKHHKEKVNHAKTTLRIVRRYSRTIR
jgi:hypothetical protein